jgi:hypothetical protein
LELVPQEEDLPSNHMQSLEELREADATGRIGEIYGELRRLCGVPVVALIFRHLATHAGLLDDIWLAVRPLLASGALQDAAATVVNDNMPPGLIPDIDANLRCAIGLAGDGVYPVFNTLDAYNRANAINLLIMLSLLRRLRLGHSDLRPQIPARAWHAPVPIAGPLLPMTNPSDMPAHIRGLVNDFGFGDRTQLDPVVPSLLRHLCAVPGLLAVLHVTPVPRFKDGTLGHAVAPLSAGMTRQASSLAPYIAPLPLLAATPAVQRTIAEFTTGWIPLMTVIGFALRRALVNI